MNWTTPTYEEVKMDAEIGSYQQDGDGENVPVVSNASVVDASSAAE